MSEDYASLIDEFIGIELNVADLYSLFFRLFPQDADFWWRLLLEEKNHASLIKSIRNTSELVGELPNSLFTSSLTNLKDINSKVTSIIRKYEVEAPSRDEAFNIALEFEQSAGELHYQEFMVENDTQELSKILKNLNADDKDHAKRIASYMNKHGIRFNEETE